MTDKKPLSNSFKKLAQQIADAYKTEIVEPAEDAIRSWLAEISSDENPYTEDKINY